MFAAGVVPGVLIGLGLMLVTLLIVRKKEYVVPETDYTFASVVKIVRRAFLPFMLPIIMIGGIVFGIFTPTEAGCVATLYALFVGFFITKELDRKKML